MTSDQTATNEQHAAFAQVGSKYYPPFVAVFTALVIISNVTATKGVAFGPIITDGGFIVFPPHLRDRRRALRGVRVQGCATGDPARLRDEHSGRPHVLGHDLFAAADFYTNQVHFENIVHAYTQLIIAGLAGFIVGQTINAWVVVAIKERTKEKHLWARLVGSTFAGQLGDTLVFCSIAAGAIGITTFGDFATYTALGWIYKTGVEVIMLPVTYRVIAYIKRHEPTYGAAV